MIYQVRDPQYEQEPIREGGKRTGEILGYRDVMVDPGEADKRLLVIESEFASILKVLEREGNTLSPVIRDLWDHGNSSSLTKNTRQTTTGAHVAIIGHITRDELLRMLTTTERGNGFANRFLIALAKRSQFLPSGKGAPEELLAPYFVRFLRTIQRAQARGVLARDRDAEDLWTGIYPKLEEEIPGMTGAILARPAAQVLRLSMDYALLDEQEAERETTAIRVPHLQAALALWDYCKASTFAIFGDAIGDPRADRLLRAIKSGPQTDTDLYEAVGKHAGDSQSNDLALDYLLRLRRVHTVKDTATGGRPVQWWHSGLVEKCALCAKRGESPDAP
ncbi:MAG TPA: DUF3987 domain-containing protein [Nitrospira sp.]|nr:DUF3987 domain-containing protein [Nitrospira sp.]